MKIDNSLKNRIKDAINIVDVIGEFITLKKKGINHIGLCPFHQDHNPSFVVSPNKQIWTCFVEQKSGDVFEFLQEHEGMEFHEAVAWCARKVNIEIPTGELTLEEIKKQKEKESLRVTITAVKDFFQAHLPDASEYLKKRGFAPDDDLIKKFGIGYAPEGNLISKQLIKQGFSEEYLKRINAIDKGNYGNYDVFRDRIMFPFYNHTGNIVGFSGRYISPKENTGKYINTKETELFKKGDVLFGLYQAKQSISNLDYAYIVEGQFDVISLHAVGVTNAIAGSGTTFTANQIKAILRFTRNVTLVYDGDTAGRKAALDKCKSLLSSGANVRCVELPEGIDPDDLAREHKEDTIFWLSNETKDFVTYFEKQLNDSPDDPLKVEESFKIIIELVAEVKEESLRNSYIKILAEKYCGGDVSIPKRRIRDIIRKLPANKAEELPPGIYGLDELPNQLSSETSCLATSNFDEFIAAYGDSPTILLHGIPPRKDIQELRRVCSMLTANAKGLSVDAGEESHFLAALAEIYRSGITDITIIEEPGKKYLDELDEEEEENFNPIRGKNIYNFTCFYIKAYRDFFDREFPSDRSRYVERCAELISYAPESVRIVNSKTLKDTLGLNQRQFNELLKPYLIKRQSRTAIAAQRTAEDYEFDPDTLPDYVDQSEEYTRMYRECKYFPRLNKDGEPVGYIFENDKGSGYTHVGDFYMQPLLHINEKSAEENKRIFKINRRYYKNPLYIEVQSKSLLKKSTIEEVLINLEAVNFSNGEEKHWIKIKEFMSRNYTTCQEVRVYGNQQKDGFTRREDENFFAFSNGIFHFVNSKPQFTPVNDIGVVEHNGKNYYLPAFSKIHAGMNEDSDKYESIRTLFYHEVPENKKCSFEHWAELMDKVYSINDNGKWAILYAVMCAFRSNIHCIDRLFTALFFMGPMMSGKTQIAISIRSLFISSKVPIFNLNTGTYAALSSLMSTFRDVPVVLDEYNNKDISDQAFQLLKGIVYDGDGRQKRKGTSGKEVETEKVYAPVILSGQETPQRDDNALMSRVIVCEVPKPITERTEEQKTLFQELKDLEDPNKVGLSNVLFEVLKLRPVVQEQFKIIQRGILKDLTGSLPSGGGDMVRIINTVSLFLTMCKILEEHSELKLPFTYDDFFQIAINKIQTQVELITRTDKIATFFKAMEVMINTGTLIYGRDYDIDIPGKITLKLPGNERKEHVLPGATKVLFLRVSNIYTLFSKSSYNPEQTTQSTIDQNLRSNPAYIGMVNAHRFKWNETKEVPKGNITGNPDNPEEATTDRTMIRIVESNEQNTSCVALNYDIFRSYYDMDLERTPANTRGNNEVTEETNIPEEPKQQPLPF